MTNEGAPWNAEVEELCSACGRSHYFRARIERLRKLIDPETSTGWWDGLTSQEIRAMSPCCYGVGRAGGGHQDPGYRMFCRDRAAAGWVAPKGERRAH